MRKQTNPIRRWRLFGILATSLCLAAGLLGIRSLAADPVPISIDSGPWRSAAPEESCPQGTICAEWPDEAQNTVTVCCIDPALVGTYQWFQNECLVMVGQRAYY